MFTKTRLVVKTVLWRVIAFIITLVVSYIETKNLGDSSLISVLNLIVKLFMLYLYELIWLRIKYGKKETNGEMKRRVCLRTTIWRIISMITTAIIVFIITRDFKAAITISVIVMIVKTICLFIYEFGWHRIKWGKIEENEDVELDQLESQNVK